MSYTGKSFTATPSVAKRKWLLVDAQGCTLGRLASRVAKVLRGKHKPHFTPNINCGDFVVVINADKIVITGNKLENNKFYWHTGHPGGIKERKWKSILSGEHPERLLKKAVQRMMPKESPLARSQMGSLRVYTGANHPHIAQNPELLDLNSI